MSFTSHELAATSPTGKYDGQYGFTVTWRLFASSGDDGPDAALDYVSLHIAQWRDKYYLGAQTISSSSSPAGSGDSNDRAELSSVTVNRVPGSADPWVWLAELTYSEPDVNSADGEDTGGNNTTDPTDIAAEIEIQTVQTTVPVEKATYVSGFSGVAHTKLNDNKQRPIVNSALCVLDPPAEADGHKFVIRIVKNVMTLDADTIKCNVVNSAAVTVSYRGISKTINALCGKTRDISAVPIKHPVIGWYVKVQLFIDVDDNTWRIQPLDRGFSARAFAGDPDGKGGYIATAGTRALAGEIAPQRRLIDKDGAACSEPQLLDGDGQPLHRFDEPAAAKDPVYSVWKYYTETDFNTWPILADVITSESSSA